MCFAYFRRIVFSAGVFLSPMALGQHADLMRFALPASVTTEDSIAVEIDGYDVTAFANLESNQLVLALEVPLTPGEHSLLVLAFAPNGEIATLLDRSLVIAPPTQQQSQWGTNASLNSSYRLDQSPDQDFAQVPELASQGALALRGLQQQGDWTVNAELDALYDSVSENLGNPTGREMSLPNYRFDTSYSGQRLRAGAAVGNIRIDQENLLFSMFQRRGAEVRVGSADQSTELRLFEVNSDPVTRVDQALVLPVQEQRGRGATLNSRIVGEALTLKLGYVDGKTQMGGAGMYLPGEPVLYGGDSWNVGLDSSLLEQSMWLHLEYAESSFDSDGIDQGEAAERDSALQALVRLQSGGNLPTGPFDYWSTTLQHQEVGARYYSLGNLSLPGDLALDRVVGQFGRQSLNLGLEWSREENNLDQLSYLPTQTLLRQALNLTYTPMVSQYGLWQWVGSPSVTLNLTDTQHSQPDTDAELVGFDLDNHTQEKGVNLSFNKDQWNWAVQWQATNLDDRSQAVIVNDYLLYNPGSDMENRMLGLQLGWLPSARTSLNLFMQFNRQTQTDLGNTYNNRNIGFDAYVQLIPDQLLLGFNYNYGADSSQLSNPDFINDDFLSHFGNGQLTWKALAPKGNTPGINLYLRGNYGRQDNRAYAWTQEQWSAHLGVELAWTAGEF